MDRRDQPQVDQQAINHFVERNDRAARHDELLGRLETELAPIHQPNLERLEGPFLRYLVELFLAHDRMVRVSPARVKGTIEWTRFNLCRLI